MLCRVKQKSHYQIISSYCGAYHTQYQRVNNIHLFAFITGKKKDYKKLTGSKASNQ